MIVVRCLVGPVQTGVYSSSPISKAVAARSEPDLTNNQILQLINPARGSTPYCKRHFINGSNNEWMNAGGVVTPVRDASWCRVPLARGRHVRTGVGCFEGGVLLRGHVLHKRENKVAKAYVIVPSVFSLTR